MSINSLIIFLKENNQEHELYPTSKSMLQFIYEHMNSNCHGNYGRGKIESILDIGCGTGNFKKYLEEYCAESGNSYHQLKTIKHFAIEKSKILIDRLDKDTIILGTDFNETTLMDKKVSCIFCNPPYSEFENWTKRIISESNCNYIYLVIPGRWKENKEIMQVIEETGSEYKILHTTDFLSDVERRARAKVDIVVIDKRYSKKDYAFDKWFDETFEINNTVIESDENKQERIKTEIAVAENKIDALVTKYNEDFIMYLEHFKAFSKMNDKVLETMGITKSTVKESLRTTIENLKITYWKLAFDNLDEITNRLTTSSRSDLIEKFKEVMQVDFTHKNIYALVIWVIKNAENYFEQQTVDFFKSISEVDNVKPYKSNEKLFKQEGWRFSKWDAIEHKRYKYTLEYRIICDKSVFHSTCYSGSTNIRETNQKINDIKVVCRNLGFEPTRFEAPENYGKKGYVYFMYEGKEQLLFDYVFYKKGTCHVRFHIEFVKALNVTASKILGWIKCKEDIKEQFSEEMAKGAEKYYTEGNFVKLNVNNMLRLSVSN